MTRNDDPKRRWAEVRIDDPSGGEYVLVLRPAADGGLEIVDPQESWGLVGKFDDYGAAYAWLREGEYEPVEGRWSPDG